MNSKGFTLIELLMSIAVLGLIFAIAIPGVNTISSAIRVRQRENLVERIEIAASKYAFDTEKTIIFVDELVTEGYIESDDEKGNILDPVNNERMNCYIVEMEKKSEFYNANFIDNKNYDINGVCNLDKLQEDYGKININVFSNESLITNANSWINGNTGIISLTASGSIPFDCSVDKCVWSSNSGANIVGSDTITLNSISSTLNTTYIFQVTVYDDEKDEIKRYKSSIDLKIDNEPPSIYENEINVTNKFVYTSTKEVQISASDGRGSGISGYYLAINNGQSCNNSSITYQSSNKFTINSNGTYLICVKDNVGNIKSGSLEISYIK